MTCRLTKNQVSHTLESTLLVVIYGINTKSSVVLSGMMRVVTNLRLLGEENRYTKASWIATCPTMEGHQMCTQMQSTHAIILK